MTRLQVQVQKRLIKEEKQGSGRLGGVSGVVMLEYGRGDHALLQYVTVHVGSHGSLNEL